MGPLVPLDTLLLELGASFIYFLLYCLLINVDSLLVGPVVTSGSEFSHTSR